eukprot:4341563-Pleurochrysis_carterae.AAC.1
MRSRILKLSLVSRSWYAAIAENGMHFTQLAFQELTLLLCSVPSYALLPSVADGLAFLDVTYVRRQSATKTLAFAHAVCAYARESVDLLRTPRLAEY